MTKFYLPIIIMFIICTSCSNDDDISFTPESINIVDKNGTLVFDGDCIDINNEYAVLVEVADRGNQSTAIEYTVNGVLYSVTFDDNQSRTNPIILIKGQNTVQLVKSGLTSSIFVVLQSDFQLIE